MKPLLSAYKEGEGQQGQQTGLPLQHRESPEVTWGGRRTSKWLVPKQYEAAKLGEAAGSLQLALFGPKWDAFTCILAQQGSAPRAEKGASVCRKRPPEPVKVRVSLGKVPMCGRPKRRPEIACSKK